MVKAGKLLTIFGYNSNSGLPSAQQCKVINCTCARFTRLGLSSGNPVAFVHWPKKRGRGSKVRFYTRNKLDKEALVTAGKRAAVRELHLYPLGIKFDGEVLWLSKNFPEGLSAATTQILFKWSSAFKNNEMGFQI